MSDSSEQGTPFPSEPATSPQYEFTPAQNDVLRNLAVKMRVVGMVLSVWGFVLCLFIVTLDFASLISGILWILLGVYTYKAADAFQQIADTTGRDISHLMEALRNLVTLYLAQFILVLLAVGVLMANLIYVLLVKVAAP